MKAVIFIGSGKISYGKLSQALDYGALTVQIAGDFDDAMARVQEVSSAAGHLPGQQRQSLPAGRAEDDHVPRAGRRCAGKCPTGSSCPAETWATPAPSARRSPSCTRSGLIDRVPRLAVINAAGANTLYELFERRGLRWNGGRPDMAIADGYYDELDAERPPGLDDRQRHRNQSAGESRQVPAGAGSVRRRGARSDRPGNPRRQGPGRRRRPGLRAGQRRQRGRREAAGGRGRDRPRRARRLHPHRPSAQRPRRPRSPITPPIRNSSTKCSAAAASSGPRSPTGPSPCPTTSTRSSRRFNSTASDDDANIEGMARHIELSTAVSTRSMKLAAPWRGN